MSRTTALQQRILSLALFAIGCRTAPTIAPAPAPVPALWDHCWWTAMETSIPPGFLMATFQRAFTEVGLPNVVASRIGDTILVRAGPLHKAEEPGTQYWRA